ncbi:MAG: MFS family permease [Planctomycetota bacterium]|jgi:MFS family permease
MTATLFRLGTLLLAVAILLMGHGLQLTLLPIRADSLGWTTSAIGITGSAYFSGLVVGCIVIPGIVARIGHIRAFMVMGALATLALLGAGLLSDFTAWLVLRFATGFAFSGLYMVIESWLSEASTRDNRGSVLAIYTVICLVGMVLGQGLLALADPDTLDLFAIGAGLLCLAIIPIGLTRMTAPHPLPNARFDPQVLLRASPVPVVCALLGGLVTGSVWAVGPLVGRSFGLEGGEVGGLMSATIIGGALSQVPVGRLSDRVDRRFVIAGIAVVGVAVSIGGLLLSGGSSYALFGAMFLVGACSMPIYALCIATASDNTDMPLIQIGSGILIMHSVGSIIGPLIVAPLMTSQGGSAFFLFVAVCFGLAAVWAVYRIVLVDRPQTHEHTFEAVPKTTPVILELSQETPLEDGVESGGPPADEPVGPADAGERVADAPLDKPST